MKIYFRTNKLRNICNNPGKAAMGKNRARKLEQRLMELQAAENLAEVSHLPPARLHQLSGNRAGQFSVDLDQPYRLLLVPANDPIPTLQDGGIDKSLVTEIDITEICDPH
ncbi:MAG: killer suppression protein [Phycisphaerae bacterium]|nr:killer suppression protein [Phycisphaerae bacterium]